MTTAGCDTAGCSLFILLAGALVLALVWDVTPRRRRVSKGDFRNGRYGCLFGWQDDIHPRDGDE